MNVTKPCHHIYSLFITFLFVWTAHNSNVVCLHKNLPKILKKSTYFFISPRIIKKKMLFKREQVTSDYSSQILQSIYIYIYKKSLYRSVILHDCQTTEKMNQNNCELDNVRNRRKNLFYLLLKLTRFSTLKPIFDQTLSNSDGDSNYFVQDYR